MLLDFWWELTRNGYLQATIDPVFLILWVIMQRQRMEFAACFTLVLSHKPLKDAPLSGSQSTVLSLLRRLYLLEDFAFCTLHNPLASFLGMMDIKWLIFLIYVDLHWPMLRLINCVLWSLWVCTILSLLDSLFLSCFKGLGEKTGSVAIQLPISRSLLDR